MTLEAIKKQFLTIEEEDGYVLKMNDYNTNYLKYTMFLLITPKGRMITTIERECIIVEIKDGKEIKRSGIVNDSLKLIRQKLKV